MRSVRKTQNHLLKKEEQKTKFFKGCLGVEEEKGNIHSLSLSPSLWST